MIINGKLVDENEALNRLKTFYELEDEIAQADADITAATLKKERLVEARDRLRKELVGI